MDLNADMGEGYSDDKPLMSIITSASFACGGHAGDAASMRYTVEVAASKGVRIGAHVSYPDREGFGRRQLSLPMAALTAVVLEQLRTLGAIARSAHAQIDYLKAQSTPYNHTADVSADLGLLAARSLMLLARAYPSLRQACL